MTAREKFIGKKVLDALHEMEGAQLTTSQIHERIGGMIVCSATELDSIVAILDAQKFITGVPTRFNRNVMKWNINDAGEAARLEM